MSRSLLANMRLFGLISESNGQDWIDLTGRIDQELEGLGLELSEEAVYLFYSHSPQAIVEGSGECFVARPVIGTKKEGAGPFILKDWTATGLNRVKLQGSTFPELINECKVLTSGKVQGGEGFILAISRRLVPQVQVSVECLFRE